MPGLPRCPRRRALTLGALVTAGCLAAAVAVATPALAATQAGVADAVHAEPLVPGTPCSVSARACVDLDTQRSWLVQDGQVVRGPVTIASGGNGSETPIGHSLRVYRKEKDHVSGESRTRDGRPSPMPWATFFEDGGIAFHGGDPSRSSAGCIRMELADAKAWFEYLQIGDKVQVVSAAEENAARGLA